MRQLDVFLDELAGAGSPAGSGSFTIDLERAREQLARYRLAEPRRYILQMVMAATRMQATWLRVQSVFSGSCLAWDGVPLEPDQLAGLWNVLIGTEPTPGLRLLALALNSCLGLEPNEICIDSAAGYRLRLSAEGERGYRTSFGKGAWSTRVWVKWWRKRFWQTMFGRPGAELALLEEHCPFSGLDLEADGTRVNRPLPFTCQAWSRLRSRDPRLDPAAATRVKPARERPAAGDYGALVMLRPGARGPATVRIALLGVELGQMTLPGLMPGALAVVNASHLTIDASMARLVEDERWKDLRADLADELGFLFGHVEGSNHPPLWRFETEGPLPTDARVQRALVEDVLPWLLKPSNPATVAFASSALQSYLRAIPAPASQLPLAVARLPIFGKYSVEELAAAAHVYQEADGTPLPHPSMPPFLTREAAQLAASHWGPEKVQPAPPNDAEEWWHCPHPMGLAGGEVGFLARRWPQGLEYDCQRPAHVWPEGTLLEGFPRGLRVSAAAASALESVEGLLYPHLFQHDGVAGHLLPYLDYETSRGRVYRPGRQLPGGLLAGEVAPGVTLRDFLRDRERYGAVLVSAEHAGPLQRFFGRHHVLTAAQARLDSPASENTPARERTASGEQVLALGPVCGPGVESGEVAIPEVDQVPLWEVELEVVAGRRQELRRLSQPLGFGPVRAWIRTPEVAPSRIRPGSAAWLEVLETVRESARQLASPLISHLEELAPGRRDRAVDFLWRLLDHDLRTLRASVVAEAPLFCDNQGGLRSWTELRAHVSSGRSLRYGVVEAQPVRTNLDVLLILIRVSQEELLLRLLSHLVADPEELRFHRTSSSWQRGNQSTT